MRPPKILYAVAIFLSSSLLFLAEPMAGKRLVPLLGGSAAVWTTCLVFFQTALLVGYLCAHTLTALVRPRVQVIIYILLLAGCLAPISRSINPELRANPAHPIISVLWLLTLLIGMPFLVLSATSPLLQAWYARSATGASTAANGAAAPQPYRLFAVSNAGSLLALLIYPWLIEPRFSLRTQNLAWAIAFGAFALVVVGIGYLSRMQPVGRQEARQDDANPESRPGVADYVLWLLLAACGSLFLSAVTNHLSENVAAIPLLWIIPLIAYLLSFVVAFGGERWRPRWLVLTLFPLALAPVAYLLYDPYLHHLEPLLHRSDLSLSLSWIVTIFCVAMFFICLFCHAELHRSRPAARHLTVFYLFIAIGGALGAIFVGVVAPTLFTGNYELACGLIFAAVLSFALTWRAGWMARIFWLAAIVAMGWVLHVQIRDDRTDRLVQLRSFYGTLYVTQTFEPPDASVARTLYHGTIEHGMQNFAPDFRKQPTTYYGHDSGVGLALDLCCGSRPRRVGAIGLGTGTVAAYGRAGDVFRFYEINAQVEQIATHVFTYLRDSAAKIEIVRGDARISMANEAPQHYDVLIVDAFSGDAIPVHLLTAEALQLYRRHLEPAGVVAFHISNHYLDLAPVVQQEAEHAGMKTAFIISPENEDTATYSSDWVLVTDNQELLSRNEIVDAQQSIVVPPGLRLWTDDYNSLLPVLKKSESTEEKESKEEKK